MSRRFLAAALAVTMSACSLSPTAHDGFPDESLRIALIADCQYADADTRGVRRYREADDKLREAVATLAAEEPDAALHLGDFIDQGWEAFDVVDPILQELPCPVHHVLGNHDFDVAQEHKLAVPARLGMPARYHAFELGGWRVVVLDGNDFSYSAWPDEHPRAHATRTFHQEIAPDSPTWNGGIGPEQIAWLRDELHAADVAKQPVLVACHFPLWPDGTHNLWNAAEVRDILCSHPSVKLYLNGHHHAGDFGEREALPFVTLEAMLDTEQNAFALLTLQGDRATIRGWGRATSRELALRAWPAR